LTTEKKWRMMIAMDEKTFFEKIRREVVAPFLEDQKQQREMSALARKLGIQHRSRLTELKNGQRELTFFWLNIFVKGGVMTAEQILRGRKFEEMSEVEKDTFVRVALDTDELYLHYKAKKQGVDVKAMLKATIVVEKGDA